MRIWRQCFVSDQKKKQQSVINDTRRSNKMANYQNSSKTLTTCFASTNAKIQRAAVATNNQPTSQPANHHRHHQQPNAAAGVCHWLYLMSDHNNTQHQRYCPLRYSYFVWSHHSMSSLKDITAETAASMATTAIFRATALSPSCHLQRLENVVGVFKKQQQQRQ